MIKRIGIFIYGVTCYLLGFGSLLYIIGFLGNLVVPRSIDGPAQTSTLAAVLINLALIVVFGLQHSIMARPGFKAKLTKWIPKEAERSTYVLATVAALGLLFWFWQPIGLTVWDVKSPAARNVLYAAFASGWAILFYSTFLIDHFELFGLRQVIMQLVGREFERPKFKTPQLYKHVRHPLYVGWLLGIWATPTMTIAHMVFAVGSTLYILTAIYFEERDLLNEHGEHYRTYRSNVPMLIPSLKPTKVV